MEDFMKIITGESNSPKNSKNDVLYFKYNEDKVLQDFYNYIMSTYGQHYVGKNNIQTMDLIISTGHAESFCISNVLKYVARYGKKSGKRNHEDLLKACHYICLLYSMNHLGEE